MIANRLRTSTQRLLKWSLSYFTSLVNEDFEGREFIHICVPITDLYICFWWSRLHHVFNDCSRLFTALPVEDFISLQIAKWLAVPPCGRYISPCFGQWMWPFQVSPKALRRAFVWFSHPRLDPRVRSWNRASAYLRWHVMWEKNKQTTLRYYLSFWVGLYITAT